MSRPSQPNQSFLCPVSREWSRVVVNGIKPNGRPYHSMTVVGSKLFVFGGRTYESVFNDMWALDLNSRTFDNAAPSHFDRIFPQ